MYWSKLCQFFLHPSIMECASPAGSSESTLDSSSNSNLAIVPTNHRGFAVNISGIKREESVPGECKQRETGCNALTGTSTSKELVDGRRSKKRCNRNKHTLRSQISASTNNPQCYYLILFFSPPFTLSRIQNDKKMSKQKQ